LVARDDAAFLTKIALLYVVQVGHRPHRPFWRAPQAAPLHRPSAASVS
jgi:hypothetical protein